jgi:hypothetical protein
VAEIAEAGMSHPWRLTSWTPSENDVEAGCLTILEFHKYYVQRVPCGTFLTLDGRYQKGAPKGTPDYACMHAHYRNFLLEVKRPGGRLSPDQEKRIEFIRLHYELPIVVVKSVDELCDFLAKHEHSP